LVVVCCSDTRFEAVAQAMKDLDAAKASLERRAHGVNLTQNTSQIWHKCLNTQQIHCIWHHLTINSQIVEKSNELWWVTTYKLWLTDLSPALTAWIWLLTCQHWDLETQHLEPDSHVPSHRMWVTRVTFLECYSMPLSWVVFNISRLEHFSDFWFKALANWFIAPCAHPAVFCSPGSDWTSQSVVSHDSGHNSVLGPDAHLCFMKVRDHPEQQERSHGRRGSSALCEEGGHGHGHTAAPKRLLLYTGSKQTSIGF